MPVFSREVLAPTVHPTVRPSVRPSAHRLDDGFLRGALRFSLMMMLLLLLLLPSKRRRRRDSSLSLSVFLSRLQPRERKEKTNIKKNQNIKKTGRAQQRAHNEAVGRPQCRARAKENGEVRGQLRCKRS